MLHAQSQSMSELDKHQNRTHFGIAVEHIVHIPIPLTGYVDFILLSNKVATASHSALWGSMRVL